MKLFVESNKSIIFLLVFELITEYIKLWAACRKQDSHSPLKRDNEKIAKQLNDITKMNYQDQSVLN